ncbi:MAG: TonB-dependent receptor [Opitutaceae bacterium]|nr:TonB-dependent receptor [Opitutaceae bacterium]
MNTLTLLPTHLRMPWILRILSTAGVLLLCGLTTRAAENTGTGVITGTVTNKTTGNGLEGAKIEIRQLGLSALVDKTGRFVLAGVPAGSHELVASYTGLDPATSQIQLARDGRATRDFELTSSLYMLDPFKVAGEREGNALAITQQRNADNLTNVVSMDAYGNLPNLNATELAIRLPGVTFGNPGDEVVEVISVRGMGAGMSTITIDGGMMSSFSAQSRQTRMTAFTGAMFESLEVIKGHTPDKGADSLGGTVNFKTRSPLNMREKRRLSYNFSVSGVPPGTDQVPIREKHRYHPLFNAAYLQKFGIFGSKEDNLAVSVNLFYSENAFGFFRTQRDYQQTNNQPAYLWDYRTTDNFNNRKQMSVNTKWDYRLSLNSLLRLNLIVNDAPEPMRRQFITRAFAGSATTNPSATTGIVPGAFTSRVTTVRANAPAANANPGTTPTAAIDLTSTNINRNQRLRHIDLGGEHTFGRFEYDWAALYSLTRYRTLGKEAQLINRIGGIPVIAPNGLPGTPGNTIVGPGGARGVGWILDRTESDLSPQFIQNGGLDFTDPNNYRPTQNGLNSNAGDLQQHRVRDVRGNVKYKLPIDSFSAFLKTGAQVREQTVSLWRNRRRWSYAGSTALPHDPALVTWDRLRTGRAIPQWEAAMFVENGQPKDPSLWVEDLYHHESNNFTGQTRVQETVYATYLMTQGRFGQNGFLTGVRGERTDTVAEAYQRARRLSTNAERLADPIGAAHRDYADYWRTLYGSYTKYFPSVHLWRNFTPNLKGRAAWSTSFGRPSMANALPTLTIDENNQRVTIGNPALLPQTAENWDFTLEYYFEPSGSFSVGWFHKTIADYIVNNVEVGVVPGGPDNGYDGEYEGFAVRMNRNAGRAIAQGWEFSYLQQFRFLPGLLRGLSLNANYTIIATHGDFGLAGAYRTKGQVPGFIPYSGNVNLSWKYKKFGARVLYNYTATHIRSYNATQPSRNQYMWSRALYNLGFEYNLRSNVKLTLDIANAENEPQRYYRGIPDQMETFLMQGTKWTVGVQGQF